MPSVRGIETFFLDEESMLKPCALLRYALG